MAPKSSSASSATRKKHAARKNQSTDQSPSESSSIQDPKPKLTSLCTQTKLSKREKREKKATREKVYIPPQTYASEADPVDTLGLGSSDSPVRPERAVMLRKISKKDPVTVERGLDEWLAWVDSVIQTDQADETILGEKRSGDDWDGIIASAQVLLYHFPRIVVHSSRRVRALSLKLFNQLLDLDEFCLELFLSPANLEKPGFIGTWILSTCDPDKSIRSIASSSWNRTFESSHATSDRSWIRRPNFMDYVEETFQHLFSLIKPQIGESKDDSTPSLPTRKVAALEESAQSTSSRLRASAFEALAKVFEIHPQPQELLPLLMSSPLFEPSIWQMILPSGDQDPQVRKSIWSLLRLVSTSESFRSLLSAIVPYLANFPLSAAFTEKNSSVHGAMISGLVPLLDSYPKLWILDLQPDIGKEVVEGRNLDTPHSIVCKSPTFESSSTIELFYSYLQSACSSNPVLLYPSLVLILRTFPLTIERSEQFFLHFWSAHSSRFLRSSGRPGMSAFYKAWSECVTLIHQIITDEEILPIILFQFDKMWSQLSQNFSGPEQELFDLSSALCFVIHRCRRITEPAWLKISKAFEVSKEVKQILRYIQFCETAYISYTNEYIRTKAKEACESWLALSMSLLFEDKNDENVTTCVPVLIELLRINAGGLAIILESDEIALFQAFRKNLPPKIWNGSKPHYDLLVATLDYGTQNFSRDIWLAVMNQKFCELNSSNLKIVSALFRHSEGPLKREQLPNPQIDQFALKYTIEIMEGNVSYFKTLEPLFINPQSFVTEGAFIEMLRLTIDSLEKGVGSLLYKPQMLKLEKLELILTACDAQIVSLGKQAGPEIQLRLDMLLDQAAVSAFIMGQFLPLARGDMFLGLGTRFENLYFQITSKFSALQLQNHHRELFQLFKACIVDINCWLHPFDLNVAARKLLGHQESITLRDFLYMLPVGTPSQSTLLSLLSFKVHSPLLGIVDPLIRVSSEGDCEMEIDIENKYDRIVLAIIDLLVQDRPMSRKELWLWEHCLYLGQIARNSLITKTSNRKNDFHSRSDLEAIVDVIDKHTAYLISFHAQNLEFSWHLEIISMIQNPSNFDGNESDSLDRLIINLVLATQNRPTESLATATFYRVLCMLFKYTEIRPKVFEGWLALCRQTETSNTSLCLAIISALNPYIHSSVKFVHYQNQLAARLTDTPSASANGEGLRLIEILSRTAPPSDSENIFLPEQRVLFLLQGLKKWLDSDEDIEFLLNGRMLGLLWHLVPIVQNITGTHWDRIFDLIEISLEEVAWEDESALTTFWYSCRLLKLFQNLSGYNRTLYIEVEPRIEACIRWVFNWFTQAPPRSTMSVVKQLIADITEDIIRDKSAQSLYAQVTKTVFSSSVATSSLAFNIARKIILNLTDSWAVKAELEPESDDDHSISSALLASLSQTSKEGEISSMLGWLLVFSYFENSSTRLRSRYNSQLSDTNLIDEKLLPLLYNVMNVTDRGKPKDVSVWGISSFNISDLNESSLHSTALAAYLYYVSLRVVPSHIRSWWEACRNKQLSKNVAGFTSKFLSPILINHELEKVKDPDLLESLTDDKMIIKVSQVAKEVKAIYIVDDETMEIIIRIPNDYPLQPVDVLDVKKVGVSESTWRAWLLVVQQAIANHNGTIAEALSLFKRNVSLHFEGVEACAICYAIISVVDRSLPSKACKTCRNRFHPSCLYKWFSTSHGSSCPLCRSLF
ncbi:hypothetical protein PPACK8108_LOCUS7884 [Phakopsora pachyrhizi]|uniref:E3 ubiquitin-protein ligase listerin n=1 Tax=Phakopsora pachyrhizi TaxID=170000 RepID=A0AAV0AU89_PHAPC|nr:hypothetical protein PPACK8108_LOCUS7884 [Phakopsora pachyrhizi]